MVSRFLNLSGNFIGPATGIFKSGVACIFAWLTDILSKPSEMSSAEAIAGTEVAERLISPATVTEEIIAKC